MPTPALISQGGPNTSVTRAPREERGVVLILVLATLLVILILSNIILSIISSQARLSHHQVSRIQAYYAAQAASFLAAERLRTGLWSYPANCQFASGGCNIGSEFTGDFPGTINSLNVYFCAVGQKCPDPAGALATNPFCETPPNSDNTFCIRAVVDYDAS
jgi:hypothetical protein